MTTPTQFNPFPFFHHSDLIILLSTLTAMGVVSAFGLLMYGLYGYDRCLGNDSNTCKKVYNIMCKAQVITLFAFVCELMFYGWKAVCGF
jgi:hypothetical protein